MSDMLARRRAFPSSLRAAPPSPVVGEARSASAVIRPVAAWSRVADPVLTLGRSWVAIRSRKVRRVVSSGRTTYRPSGPGYGLPGNPERPGVQRMPGEYRSRRIHQRDLLSAIIAGIFGELQERGGQWSTSGATRVCRSIKSNRP